MKADPTLAKIQLVGYVSHVQGELKQAAQEAGCDMVLARSAFSQNLLQILTRQKNRDGADFARAPPTNRLRPYFFGRRTRSKSAVNCLVILSATSALAPSKLRAVALLRSGPHHVAVLIHQPHRRHRLMLAFINIGGFVLAHTRTEGSRRAAANAPAASIEPGAAAASRCLSDSAHMRVDAFRRLKIVRVDQVLRRSAQKSVGAIAILRQHK